MPTEAKHMCAEGRGSSREVSAKCKELPIYMVLGQRLIQQHSRLLCTGKEVCLDYTVTAKTQNLHGESVAEAARKRLRQAFAEAILYSSQYFPWIRRKLLESVFCKKCRHEHWGLWMWWRDNQFGTLFNAYIIIYGNPVQSSHPQLYDLGFQPQA